MNHPTQPDFVLSANLRPLLPENLNLPPNVRHLPASPPPDEASPRVSVSQAPQRGSR
jgi:hypothetical protein